MNQNVFIKLIGQRIQRLPDSKSQLFEDEVITSKFCEELQACVCLPSYSVYLVCPRTWVEDMLDLKQKPFLKCWMGSNLYVPVSCVSITM